MINETLDIQQLTTSKIENIQIVAEKIVEESTNKNGGKIDSVSESNNYISTEKVADVVDEVKISAFSLSSIKAKKELQEKNKSIVVAHEILPSEIFTENDMRFHWKAYAETLAKRGMRIMESLLLMNEPTLDGQVITFELPNEGSKLDFESEKMPLLRYLFSKLNNHEIIINVVVNEIVEKKFAFTPQDKYDRLRAINPKLELLKRTFDLDY